MHVANIVLPLVDDGDLIVVKVSNGKCKGYQDGSLKKKHISHPNQNREYE